MAQRVQVQLIDDVSDEEAQDNGHNPSARGRITRSIIDAYNESR